MSQILGIKFSDHGPVCYFSSGEHELRTGQYVLVETDQGQALGRVATVKMPDAEASPELPMAHLAAQPAPVAASLEPAQPVEPEGPSGGELLAPFEDTFSAAGWGGSLPGDAAEAVFSQEAGMLPDAPADGNDSPQEKPDAGHADGCAAQGATISPVALFASDQAVTQPIPHSTSGLECVSRLATEADLEVHAENRRLARRAFTFCRGCINSQNLDMKLVDVEVLHDRSKLIFFFTAPNRIDFRELIKSLVREFHTRIELRQIGVRHETQMIGAIGNCGQVCCCRRFLRKFAPVTIKMAKEQNLFLNPAKISGICGRLLCCLSYEQKGYEEFHKQCPKIGKRIQTPIGSVKVLRANFFKKSISVWVEDVGEREFTLDEWREMLNRQPGDAPAEAPVQEPQARPARSPGRVSTGRPARPERGSRPERPERQERSDKSERPERSDRPERAARPERSDRPEKSDRPDRPDRPDKAERPERAAAAPAPLAGAEAKPDAPARPQGGEGEARERTRPRRKRRKSKGPKPA
jgi:cell fate regulator YaaT (PSP1 superfamily)